MIEPGSTKDERRAVAKQDPGSVYVKHSQDDQLLHLCWKNRKNSATELVSVLIFFNINNKHFLGFNYFSG